MRAKSLVVLRPFSRIHCENDWWVRQSKHAFRRWRMAFVVFCVGFMAFTAPNPVAAQIGENLADGTPPHNVRQLVKELGSPSYATRTRAQGLLQGLGLEALEELRHAQFDSDIEVEMAARYLAGSLTIRWSKETDPLEVQEVLLEYGAQSDTERTKRIGRLESLSNRSGLGALVRLVRYEKSEPLSRQAALAILRQKDSKNNEARKQNSQIIKQGISHSNRNQAKWLRIHADDIESGTYSDQEWRKIVLSQREQLDNRISDITRDSVLQLVRTCAGSAARRGHRDEATRLVSDHLDLLEPTTRSLNDACTWAKTHQLDEVVLEIRREFQFMFDKHAELLYRAAEAHQVLGRHDQAEELAQHAIAINGFPTGDAAKKTSARDREELAIMHYAIAEALQRRGLHRWSFREYELIIANTEIDTLPNWMSRLIVVGAYKKHRKFEDIIRVLKPLIERVEKDEQLQLSMETNMSGNASPEILRGMLNHALAQLALKENKLGDAQRMLSKAFDANPKDIDILIQMYHTEGDEIWRSKVKQLLNKTVRDLKTQIKDAGIDDLFGRPDPFDVAELHNNCAWLIANTEGDYQLALKYSLQSLENRRDGARLDTCARCYFAVGEIDEAIEMQKEAIEVMPHEPELERQLQEFQAAKGVRGEE